MDNRWTFYSRIACWCISFFFQCEFLGCCKRQIDKRLTRYIFFALCFYLRQALQQFDNDNPRLRATAIHAALLDSDASSQRDRGLAAWDALLRQDTDSQLAALDLIPDLQHLNTTERQALEAACTANFSKLLASDKPGIRLRTLHGMRAWHNELPESVRQKLAAALQNRQAGLREAAAACLHLIPPAERQTLALQALGDGNRSTLFNTNKVSFFRIPISPNTE